MSHGSWFQPWLDDVSNDHPLSFLERFAPVHRRWHGLSLSQRPIGFLTFHKEIIEAFRSSLQAVNAEGILPPAWDDPRYPYDESLDSVDDLVTFSRGIEGWYNTVHMTFPLSGFADPERNIYMRRFWSLHLLIDQKFDECLQRNGIARLADMDSALHPTV